MEMATPRTSTSTARAKRDTGFPDSCKARNAYMQETKLTVSIVGTNLPHPEANLSPDAVISQDDLTHLEHQKRSRLSFLHRHHRNVTTHGMLSPQMAALHSVLSVATIDTSQYDESRRESTGTSKASSVGETKERNARDDTPPTSPEGSEAQTSKSGGLSKWFRG